MRMPILTGSPLGGATADVTAGASVSAGAVVSSGAAVVSAGASASVVVASPPPSPHAANSSAATVNTAKGLVRFVVDMRDPPCIDRLRVRTYRAITTPAPNNLVTVRRTSVRLTTMPPGTDRRAHGGAHHPIAATAQQAESPAGRVRQPWLLAEPVAAEEQRLGGEGLAADNGAMSRRGPMVGESSAGRVVECDSLRLMGFRVLLHHAVGGPSRSRVRSSPARSRQRRRATAGPGSRCDARRSPLTAARTWPARCPTPRRFSAEAQLARRR